MDVTIKISRIERLLNLLSNGAPLQSVGQTYLLSNLEEGMVEKNAPKSQGRTNRDPFSGLVPLRAYIFFCTHFKIAADLRFYQKKKRLKFTN